MLRVFPQTYPRRLCKHKKRSQTVKRWERWVFIFGQQKRTELFSSALASLSSCCIYVNPFQEKRIRFRINNRRKCLQKQDTSIPRAHQKCRNHLDSGTFLYSDAAARFQWPVRPPENTLLFSRPVNTDRQHAHSPAPSFQMRFAITANLP